jgi:mannose-6-phosphate isomerase-like protein (cupin superfamily)
MASCGSTFILRTKNKRINGKGYVQMAGTSFTVEQGIFYLTGPEGVHEQISDRNNPMDEICLQHSF